MSPEGRRIFVTGGAGFIDSEVVRQLYETGANHIADGLTWIERKFSPDINPSVTDRIEQNSRIKAVKP